MIVRTVVIGLLLLVAAALQTAVLPILDLAGFRPDLVLLVPVAFAIHDGPASGVRIGFAAGLLTDVLVATSAIGVAALVMTVVGYAVGTARPYLAPNSATAPLLLCFLGSTTGSLLLGTLSTVLGDASASLGVLVTSALVVGVTHTLLIVAFQRVTRGISARFPTEGTPGVR